MYRRRMCTHFHKGVRLLSVLSASFPWPRSASSLILSLPALSCLCVLLPSLPANQDKKKNPNPPACCLQMVHSLLRASECSTSGSRDLSPAVSTDHTLPPCHALPCPKQIGTLCLRRCRLFNLPQVLVYVTSRSSEHSLTGPAFPRKLQLLGRQGLLILLVLSVGFALGRRGSDNF